MTMGGCVAGDWHHAAPAAEAKVKAKAKAKVRPREWARVEARKGFMGHLGRLRGGYFCGSHIRWSVA